MCVHLVDLVKSFPTNIYLQNLASIQKRTSPVKFPHLAEKSGNGSISNLSTKAPTSATAATATATATMAVTATTSTIRRTDHDRRNRLTMSTKRYL